MKGGSREGVFGNNSQATWIFWHLFGTSVMASTGEVTPWTKGLSDIQFHEGVLRLSALFCGISGCEPTGGKEQGSRDGCWVICRAVPG